MLHQILKMLLAEEQVLLQFYVMSSIFSVDLVYFCTFSLDNGQLFGPIVYDFFYFFWIKVEILMAALISVFFSL